MNLQEVNWNEMTEEQNLDVYKFNIDVTDNDVHQCKKRQKKKKTKCKS